MNIEVQFEHWTNMRPSKEGERPDVMLIKSLSIEGRQADYKKAAVRMDGEHFVTLDIEGLVVSDLKVKP